MAVMMAASEFHKDLLALLVGLAGAIGVILYAASSDLFDLKFFKIDPGRAKVPRRTRVEYWYSDLAKRWYDFLFKGGWRYAKSKKTARVTMKRGWREWRRKVRKYMPDELKRLNRDMGLGALVLLIMLVLFLLVKLL